MTFFNVRVLDPSDTAYRVDIDDDASVDAIKATLVQGMQLDPGKRYELQLVDALSLAENALLRLREVDPPAGAKNLKLDVNAD